MRIWPPVKNYERIATGLENTTAGVDLLRGCFLLYFSTIPSTETLVRLLFKILFIQIYL